MTPERWERLKPLFEAALEKTAVERDAFIAELRARGEDLADQLSALVTAHLAGSGPLDEPYEKVLQRVTGVAASISVGDVIMDRYEIVRLVGQGGMGEVFEANDREMGRIALKTIRAHIAEEPAIVSRFRREVALARRIASANVCRIHEFYPASAYGTGERVAFLTMEFLDGPTLAERIAKNGPLPPDEAEKIALQLCGGLQAIHQAGVIHRDFKSRNVMLASRNGSVQAVITDFGLARELSSVAPPELTESIATQPGTVMGTPAYMAPEQFKGATATPATDVYALGVVLYEMVAGQNPFAAITPIAAAVQRAKELPAVSSIHPGIPRRWDAVIGRCLEFDASWRFQSAAEVAEALRGKARPKRWGWIAAALVFVLVAIIAGYLYWSRGSGPSLEARHWYDEGTAALREGTYLKATNALERAVALDKNFALAHARLADAWNELDFTDKAKDEMLQATSPTMRDTLSSLDSEYVEAVRATVTNDLPRALEIYQHILVELPVASRPYGYVDLGRVYEKAGRIHPAIEAYNNAAQKASEYPASFLHLGALQSRLKHIAEAEAAFERADALYRASSNAEGLAEVDYQRALAASDQGRLEPARGFAEKALSDSRSIPSVQLEIRALLLLSAIDHRSGDLDRASQLASQAIQLVRDNGISSFWSIQGLVQLGNPYLIAGDYHKAESYFTDALNLARRNKSRRLEAAALVSLASLRNKQGHPEEVIPLAEAALKYYQERGFITQTNLALVLIGRSKRDKGDLVGSLQAFNDQLALGKRVGDSGITALAEEGIGGVQERLERYPEALTHFRAATQAGKELGPEFLAVQALHCAGVLQKIGRYDESESTLKRLPQITKTVAELFTEIANVSASAALSQGHNAKALVLCRQALRSKSPRSSGTETELTTTACLAQVRLGFVGAAALCHDAFVRAGRDSSPYEYHRAAMALAEAFLAQGLAEKAKELTFRAFVNFHASSQRESEWRSLLLLARIYRQQRNSVEAGRFAIQAIDILNAFDHNWEAVNSDAYRNRPDVRAAREELATLRVRQ